MNATRSKKSMQDYASDDQERQQMNMGKKMGRKSVRISNNAFNSVELSIPTFKPTRKQGAIMPSGKSQPVPPGFKKYKGNKRGK